MKVARHTVLALAPMVLGGILLVTLGGCPIPGTSNRMVTSIGVSPTTAGIGAGETVQYTATASYNYGSDADVTSQVTWSSDNSGVATIDASGLATGVAAGSTNIRAALTGPTVGSHLASAYLQVAAAQPILESIAVTPAAPSVAAGRTLQLTATAAYSAGSDANVTSQATWTSSNPAVATVSVQGLLTGVALGAATITAALEGVNGSTSVTVIDAGADYRFLSAGFPTSDVYVLDTLTLGFSYLNSGTLGGTQRVTVSLYLSADDTLDDGDTVLSSATYDNVGVNTSLNSQMLSRWPETPGSFHLILTLAAADDVNSANDSLVSDPVSVLAEGTVDDPIFGIPGGVYTEAQIVAFSTSTAGARIYYTDDGSDPSRDHYGGYADGASDLFINVTATVKARAYKDHYIPSSVASAAYELVATVPTFSVPQGSYTSAQSVTMATVTPGATIHYTIDGSPPSASSTSYGGAVVADRSMTLQAMAVKGGWTDSNVSAADYELVVTAPTFSVPGGTYTSAQSVGISTVTPSVTIHYTMDGSPPTGSSATYTEPVTVDQSVTLQAIAVRSGWTDSEVAVGVYEMASAVGLTFYQRLLVLDVWSTVEYQDGELEAWLFVTIGTAGSYTVEWQDFIRFDTAHITSYLSMYEDDKTTIAGGIDSANAYYATSSRTVSLVPGTYFFRLSKTTTYSGTSQIKIHQ